MPHLPTYIQSETDHILETAIQNNFDTLQNYAYNHGNYLLEDPQFRIFETTHVTNLTLSSILLQFTAPIADQNIQAMRRLRTLQRSNLRQAITAYERLISPRLLMRMHQQHQPGRQDSPILRILTPPRSNTPTPPEIHIPLVSQLSNNRTRTTRQRRCFKCHQTTHEKRHCPRYRCPHCRHLQPGHIARYCPEKPIPDFLEQDYSHDYDPDNNLNGE